MSYGEGATEKACIAEAAGEHAMLICNTSATCQYAIMDAGMTRTGSCRRSH